MRRLRSTKNHEQFLVLSAPATVALCLDEARFGWPKHRPAKILILGSASLATLDDAEWFQFLPAMFRKSGPIDVVVSQGATLERRSSSATRVVSSAWRVNATFDKRPLTAILNDASYREYFVQDEPTFDMAICFNEFAWGEHLLADLQALRTASIPLYFTSYSETSALMRHALFRAHCANAKVIVSPNPFSLVSMRVGENWNRVISKIEVADLPTADATYDEEFASTLKVTNAVVLNSHMSGQANQAWQVGSPVDENTIHTMDGFAVKTTDHTLINLDTSDVVGTLRAEWHEIIESYDEQWDDVDRLIWASHIRFYASADGLVPSEAFQVEHGDANRIDAPRA